GRRPASANGNPSRKILWWARAIWVCAKSTPDRTFPFDECRQPTTYVQGMVKILGPCTCFSVGKIAAQPDSDPLSPGSFPRKLLHRDHSSSCCSFFGDREMG